MNPHATSAEGDRPILAQTIVTIDGPAGSGKSTVARMLAERLGYLYLDTGAMYRAVALQALRTATDLNDRRGLHLISKSLELRFEKAGEKTRLFLGEEDISSAIRSREMDMLSSKISAVKEVRSAMTELQQKIGSRGRLVAEGRDMGTVVFPGAAFKFFLTASLEVRAQRRYRERIGQGESVTMEVIRDELRVRDMQDRTRVLAPLRQAEDALPIDTSHMDATGVLDLILSHMGRGPGQVNR